MPRGERLRLLLRRNRKVWVRAAGFGNRWPPGERVADGRRQGTKGQTSGNRLRVPNRHHTVIVAREPGPRNRLVDLVRGQKGVIVDPRELRVGADSPLRLLQ